MNPSAQKDKGFHIDCPYCGREVSTVEDGRELICKHCWAITSKTGRKWHEGFA